MNSKDDVIGLKDKLTLIEKDFEGKLKEVEEKEEKFKIVDDRIEEYVKKKDMIMSLNIGGNIFQTRISTLMKLKDSLFYNIIKEYIEQGGELPQELFIDRSYEHFPLILEYIRSRTIHLKGLPRFVKEDILTELEYYGLADTINHPNKFTYDLEWDQNLSKIGMCTVNPEDKRNINIHSNSCYTHFLTNRIFTNENFIVELESTVIQNNDYYYIGIINENYITTGNCMCCNPANSYYIQCDGSVHINSVKYTESSFAWRSNCVTIGLKIKLKQREIYFYIPEKCEIGPYSIGYGNQFRVVAGHCNNGSGEITIRECYEID